MKLVTAPRRRRNGNFDLPAKRRKEIVLHACLVGAMETEDRSRWLIAWHWHNRKAADPIWSLMQAATRMGGEISEVEASEITEEASICRKHLSADNLAKFLGVTYEQRQTLRLTTIGSIDVKKRARKELRKLDKRRALEAKRRAIGVRPRDQYEADSITAKARAEGVSRMTIYRRQKRGAEQVKNTPHVTGVCPPIFLTTSDRPVTPERKGLPGGAVAPKQARGYPSSQTASTMAGDRHAALPIELRLLALGLPMPENLARAASNRGAKNMRTFLEKISLPDRQLAHQPSRKWTDHGRLLHREERMRSRPQCPLRHA